MPLSFLTADRGLEPHAQDVALAPGELERWRRPYRPGPWRVATAALTLLLAAYLLLSAMIIAMAGPLFGATATVIAGGLAIGFALRLLRMGLWVSSRGVRQVALLTTRTLRWREVSRVSTVQQPVKWLGLPRTVQGQALLIERRRSEPLRTVLTDHNSDFLGRPEAFDAAADLMETWAAEHR